jgi:hypothetical protein
MVVLTDKPNNSEQQTILTDTFDSLLATDYRPASR